MGTGARRVAPTRGRLPGRGEGASGCVAVVICTLAALVLHAAPAHADACPNAAFRGGPSAALPDCRAYELVTPPFSGGQSFFEGPPAVAADGSALIFETLGAPGASEADPSASGAAYRAERTPAGWSSTALEPPSSLVENSGTINPQMPGVSQDLRSELFFKSPRSSSYPVKALAGVFYVRQSDGTLAEVGPSVSPATVAEQKVRGENSDLEHHTRTWEASRDLSTVLFSDRSAAPGDTNWQWPGDTTNKYEPSLYQYSGTEQREPVLVGVSNEGPLHGSPHVNEGAHLLGECGVELGSGPGLTGGIEEVLDRQNAVSRDGSVVFFTPNGPNQRIHSGTEFPECTAATLPAAELFARVGGAHTVAISEPASGDCALCNTSAPGDAVFQGASEDGSKAFFLTSQELLSGNPGRGLYEYDFKAPSGRKVIAVSHLAGAGEAGVLGVTALANDGSHIYYVATAVETAEANAADAHAQPGQPNLYVYDTTTTSTRFVGTLSVEDAASWSVNTAERFEVSATPDGRFLLFGSRADLTTDATGSGSHLYQYDAQTGALARVSVGQAGFNNNGNVAAGFFIKAGVLSGQAQIAPPLRSMSDDGQYVFFESSAALTPQALEEVCAWEVEGTCFALARNVYEYRAGKVFLVSDGLDRHAVLGGSAVQLVGTDATGANVFLTNADPLVAQDSNTQQDIYDARIGGGFPASTPSPGCEGASCQGAPSAAPPEATPASALFTGPGNLAPPPSSPVTKPLTQTQRLAKALKACRTEHDKRKRRVCEAEAHRRYGSVHKGKRATTRRRVSR
jgi:hypothetical protein